MGRVAQGWLGEAGVAPGRELLAAGRTVLTLGVALTALGWVMAYSSSSARAVAAQQGLNAVQQDVNAVFVRQACWTLIAAAGCVVMARVPLETLGRWSRPLLTAVIVMLVATKLVGVEVNGARRWLGVGGFRFQPSELLKLVGLLYMADALARREQRAHFDATAPAAALLAPFLLGIGLVFLQPDLGTSLFLVAECLVLLGLAGVRPARVGPAALLLLPLLVGVAWAKFPHVQKRWDTWAQSGTGGPRTQVDESLLAIGSGGLLGRGLGEGTQKLHYVAESNTDFIGAVLGEELGFVGCAAMILAFMGIAWCGRKITLGARALAPQAIYLAGGAAFIIVFQAAINLAVVTNSAPTKGIPLPFISVGGSNLVLMLCCVGLLVNVARRAASAAGDPDLA
jgi:cell division protein FtsW